MVAKHGTTDERVVYGFFCSWWGGIEETGPHHSGTPGLPACPHCGNGLMQLDSAKQWWDGVDKFNEKVPGYRDFISWLKGKCYRGGNDKGYTAALEFYNANVANRPGRVKVVMP